MVGTAVSKLDRNGETIEKRVRVLEPEQEKKVVRDGETTLHTKVPDPETQVEAVLELLEFIQPFEQPVYAYNPSVWDYRFLDSVLGSLQCKAHIPKHTIQVRNLERQTVDLMPAVAETLPQNGSLPNTLEDAADALGIDHETYDDDDDVYSLFQEGRTTKLKEYLLNDLEMTGKLATRLRQQDLIHR